MRDDSDLLYEAPFSRCMCVTGEWVDFFGREERSRDRFVIENAIKTSFHPSLGLSSTFNLCPMSNCVSNLWRKCFPISFSNNFGDSVGKSW